ncbi:amiloride-sensitive sodium channel-related [Clonorchis sinensis]|uniref:Amiloride-sensitive sodium channel-related n=1 Tax=Clonorchis sinensis TaxID=79923 RepID=G7YPH9_CLOSI|nr:amiloride-sensitive sodium channel-related [Clonorchis sinensis]
MAITSSNLIKLVSDTFTIRGVPRLNRGPRFLRGLWWFFVITMTVGLFLTSYYLVQDYLLYDVAVNVHVALDAHSPFPALTVCHHHPFSAEAYRLWRENKVLSPSAFNREMRKLTQYHLERNNLDISSNLYQYDSMSIYYQNLNTEDAYRLGHDTSIFLNCMRRVNQAMQIEDDCTKMDGFRIRKFSHHTFFNCHTIEPTDKMEAEATDTIALVVGLGPKPDYSDEEQAFLMDLYEMAQGLRLSTNQSSPRCRTGKRPERLASLAPNRFFGRNGALLRAVKRYRCEIRPNMPAYTALFAQPCAEWKRPRGGQCMTWQRSTKALTSKLSRVGNCRLPGWGPRDATHQWLMTLAEMAQSCGVEQVMCQYVIDFRLTATRSVTRNRTWASACLLLGDIYKGTEVKHPKLIEEAKIEGLTNKTNAQLNISEPPYIGISQRVAQMKNTFTR